jgi:hypothetical protein
MTPPPDDNVGCAVRPDGTLKDAAEIEWHFDKDDEIPLTAAEKLPGSSPAASSSSPSPSQTVHPFFSGHAPPAISVRRSGRAIRPSNRVVDPDNAMNFATQSKVVTGKRKAPNQTESPRRVIQKAIHTIAESGNPDKDNSDGEDHTPSRSMRGELTDIAIEDAMSEQEYLSLKAMGDADHEVSGSLTTNFITLLTYVLTLEAIHLKAKRDATADIRTIFRREKEHKNPDTAKVQDGYWCKLCL